MKILKKIKAKRDAIKKLKHDTPLILASNCMGGRDSETFGLHHAKPTWQIEALKKPVGQTTDFNAKSIEL